MGVRVQTVGFHVESPVATSIYMRDPIVDGGNPGILRIACGS